MSNLALFDFDGTITTADTFIPFIRYAVDPGRMAVGRIVLAPIIVAYKMGLVHASPVRANIVRVGFSGKRVTDVRRLGASYAQDHFPKVIRPKALQRIKWHKDRGDTVAVVSASLDVYLSEWCHGLGLDLICTELEVRHDTLTGRYRPRDCTGTEKARRVLEKYDLKAYPVIYAYGDTKDDEALLNLAHRKYFRWREIAELNDASLWSKTSRSDPNNSVRLGEIAHEDKFLDALVAQQHESQSANSNLGTL